VAADAVDESTPSRVTHAGYGLTPQLLERAIAHFQKQGYVPFLLLDDDERGHFVDRFTGATSLAALDWEPVAALDGVAIYDVARAALEQPR